MKQIQLHYNKYPYPNRNVKSLEELNKCKWILNSLPYSISKESSILDVGCGTGEEVCFLSQFGNVTGIDFSENAINIANKLKEKLGIKNISFYVRDITKEKGEKKFDYIFCIGVLHHIPEVDKAIENIKTYMNMNTIAVFSVANTYATLFDFILRPLRKLIGINKDNTSMFQDYYNNPYCKTYTKKEFTSLLDKHKLKVIKIWRDVPEIIRLMTQRMQICSFCIQRSEVEKIVNGEKEVKINERYE